MDRVYSTAQRKCYTVQCRIQYNFELDLKHFPCVVVLFLVVLLLKPWRMAIHLWIWCACALTLFNGNNNKKETENNGKKERMKQRNIDRNFAKKNCCYAILSRLMLALNLILHLNYSTSTIEKRLTTFFAFHFSGFIVTTDIYLYFIVIIYYVCRSRPSYLFGLSHPFFFDMTYITIFSD